VLIFHPPNKLYTIKSPRIAIASAKTKAKIIESNIFGAAEGLRPRARTLAKPTAAITPEGPNVLINIIKIIVKFFISFSYCVYRIAYYAIRTTKNARRIAHDAIELYHNVYLKSRKKPDLEN